MHDYLVEIMCVFRTLILYISIECRNCSMDIEIGLRACSQVAVLQLVNESSTCHFLFYRKSGGQASGSRRPASNNKRYLILTYTAEYDR